LDSDEYHKFRLMRVSMLATLEIRVLLNTCIDHNGACLECVHDVRIDQPIDFLLRPRTVVNCTRHLDDRGAHKRSNNCGLQFDRLPGFENFPFD